jgi:diacylglycerol kinase family enzyme
VLLINPRSGGGRAARVGLAGRARELGIECVELHPGEDLAGRVSDAVDGGADALGIAGGDGSLGIVATAAIAHSLPLVCVPAGTRNHLARDLGLPYRELLASLTAFAADAAERWIDVGAVNGRLFVNNVSLGIYGDAVARPGYRDAKLQTLLATAEAVLGPSATAPPLRIADDLGREHREPAVLLVSNNPYALNPSAPGGRPRLDTGRLGVIVLDRPDVPPHRARRAWTARSLDVAGDAALHAGVDGEAITLEPPLHFACRPAALCVRVPRRRSRS